MKCSIRNCDNPSRARTWCFKHYKRWQTHGNPETSLIATHDDGHVRSSGYRFVDKGGVRQFEHRHIMGLRPGDGKVVHHIDGNKLNNDPANLRVHASQADHIRMEHEPPRRTKGRI